MENHCAWPTLWKEEINGDDDDDYKTLGTKAIKLGVWSDLPVVQAGTSIRMANRPGGQRGQNWNVQGNLEPAAIFFWQRRGRSVAGISLSLKNM